MTMRRNLAAALFVLPLPAMAQCPAASALSCDLPRGRHLEICATDTGFTYHTSTKGRSELQLSVPYESANVTPWPGIGHSMWNDLTFYNRDHSYEVFTAIERDPTAEPEMGVAVRQGGREIARLRCVEGSIKGNPLLFEEAMSAAGLCPEGDAWARRRHC